MEARLSATLSGPRPATVAQSAVVEAQPETVAAETDALVENGVNVWPDEAAETAFLTGLAGVAEPAVAVVETPVVAVEVEEKDVPLPALDEMVQRLSPATREMLDDLFRAKFVTVRRVPKQALKE